VRLSGLGSNELLRSGSSDEPLVQQAHFHATAYALTLSLSATDPQLHQGGPIGLGNVYLWLDRGPGASAVKARWSGSLDVRGRRVVRLLDGPRAPGVYGAAWSGQDDAGRAVPAGVYFVRLDTDGFTRTRRITYLGR